MMQTMDRDNEASRTDLAVLVQERADWVLAKARLEEERNEHAVSVTFARVALEKE